MKNLLLILSLLVTSLSFSQMTTAGSAVQFGGCNCYQLTSTGANLAGAIWGPQPIDMTTNFDMTFQVYLGTEDPWGADGMAFVLQENPNGVGMPGHSLGYEDYWGNLNPLSLQSIAIELDTWNSSPTVASDISNDHMGISSNGLLEHDLVGPTSFPGAQNIEDGAYHQFRVQWIEALKILNVYWQGNVLPMITLNNDLVANIFGGTTSLYWGFTAGTGGAFNEHRVCASGSAAFTTNLTTLCPGSSVQFTDASISSTGFIVSRSWDFGDGSPLSTSQNPSHVYNAPGVYTTQLTIVDGFGCTYTSSTDITVLDSITMNMTAADVTCFGDTDGTTTSTPTNGTGPYTYGWNDGGTQATQTATNLSPGWYTVMVTDNLGCVGFDSVEVMEPAEITLTMDSTDASCNGGMDGQAMVTVNNGVSPFAYLWDDGSAQTSATAINLGAGIYTVVVTDNDGCTATNSVEVVESSGLIVNMDSIPVVCFGGNNGSAMVTVTSGTGPFTYLWNDPGNQTTNTATGLSAGTYTVLVTGSGGCAVTDTVIVTQPPAVSAAVTVVPVACNGESTGEATVTASNGVTPYSYLWNDSNAQTTATATGLPMGIYNVVVTDNNGCTASASGTIVENTVISGTAISTNDSGAGDGLVNITVSGGVSPYSYSWSNGGSTEDISGLTEGTYDVLITDAVGCTFSLSATVEATIAIALPSAMSPNGDNLNDAFVVQGLQAYPQNKLVITNRWGNVVYETEDYANNWYGLNKKGEELPEGVYFVVLEIDGGEQYTTYLELRRK